MKATNSTCKKGSLMKYSNNIWKAHDFVMAGREGKHKVIEVAKHFKRCMVYSWQRIARGYADIDVWNMYMYLQKLLPDMLQTLKDTRHGFPLIYKSYSTENEFVSSIVSHAEWKWILGRMIFFWRESLKETCTKKNPYEKKYSEAQKECSKRFGPHGEKLPTKEENGIIIKKLNFMDDLPEYREIAQKYKEAERKLYKYRERCKDEAMNLMNEVFFCLRIGAKIKIY